MLSKQLREGQRRIYNSSSRRAYQFLRNSFLTITRVEPGIIYDQLPVIFLMLQLARLAHGDT
jgi:hypothetical protein